MTRRLAWTFAITAAAIFMVTLDNLVVTTALPVLRDDLGASLADLEWTVNAYTLTFAVFLLTGAALECADRYRRRAAGHPAAGGEPRRGSIARPRRTRARQRGARRPHVGDHQGERPTAGPAPRSP